MHAHLNLRLAVIEWEETNTKRKGLRHYTQRIWDAITKRIRYDKDGIFTDPSWPHLWS